MAKATLRDVTCTVETELAIQIDDEHWIPKSAIHDNSEVYQLDDEGDLVVEGWFAKKEGWDLD